MRLIEVFTDGGARGNPGPAACGVAVFEKIDGIKKQIGAYSKYLGSTTNNQAEYQGVILALEKIQEYKNEVIDFYLDSELVVKQLNKEYKIKDKDLGKLYLKIYNLLQAFKKVTFSHVPREQNKEADRLVNQELDKQVK